jgi:nickel-dependent lactate racemase
MKIEIPYNGGIITVNVPEKNIQDVIEPVDTKLLGKSMGLIESLSSPIGSVSFDEFVSSAKDLLVIVNDAQRPICTPVVLEMIREKIKNKLVKYLVATGSHKPPIETELSAIFGKFYNSIKNDIFIHRSKADDEMVFLGITSNGTPVRLNRLLFEYDKIITITSVEPHNFAGYTGGRKSIIPGISSYETIERNHWLALKKGAENLIINGNPVSEDMHEALAFIRDKEIYSIQTVLDKDKNVYRAFGGNIEKALHAAARAADEIYAVPVNEKADIIVAVPYPPLDADLYQAHKAIENAKPILKEGGILILTASCKEGIGPDNFYKLLSKYDDPDLMLERFEKAYKLGEHKSAKIARLQKWAQIWTVSEMKPEILEAIRFRPFSSLERALEEAIIQKGKDASITILLDGGITVPRLKDVKRASCH